MPWSYRNALTIASHDDFFLSIKNVSTLHRNAVAYFVLQVTFLLQAAMNWTNGGLIARFHRL
jgi:hypothetical protein